MNCGVNGIKASLYVETTIPSYLIGDISPIIATTAHPMAMRHWWENRRDAYRLYVSSVVDEEISRGKESLSRQRQGLLVGLPRLPVTEGVTQLAEKIFAHLKLPNSVRLDAFHLAISSHYRLDYLLTWNLKHIAGGRVHWRLPIFKKPRGQYSGHLHTGRTYGIGGRIMSDEFVEGIHGIRRQIAEECDYDFKKLADRFIRLQEQHRKKLVFEVPKTEPEPQQT